MSKVSCVSSGKATESPLRMARAELLRFLISEIILTYWVFFV